MKRPRLTRALVLEARGAQGDGAGGFSSDWQALGTLWADVRNAPGRARVTGGVARSVVRTKITVRAAPVGSQMRPVPDQRFRDGARLFRIEAVAELDPGARYLVCSAVEEVAT